MQWTVASRVRMDKQGKKAYQLAFSKTFEKCKIDHSSFEVGIYLFWVSVLTGVMLKFRDWVHLDARKLLKGCSVHWSRLWQQVRNRV